MDSAAVSRAAAGVRLLGEIEEVSLEEVSWTISDRVSELDDYRSESSTPTTSTLISTQRIKFVFHC